MRFLLILTLILNLAVFGCSKEDDSDVSDSVASQLGEMMAGIDDSGGSTGSYAFIQRAQKNVAKVEAGVWNYQDFVNAILPKAHAASCFLTDTFGSCTSNVIERDFQDCTLGGATFSGTVTFTFDDASSDSTCQMTATNHSVTRNPDFTITGSRGGTYTVSKTGTNGQVVTKQATASTYNFTNDGLRRVLTYNGNTLADWTSNTQSAITVTGDSRDGRVADGGILRVTNNLTEETCDFVPDDVTWSASCNCATSGTWTVSCSSSGSGSYEISGCGSGTLTLDGSSEVVSLDQCSGT